MREDRRGDFTLPGISAQVALVTGASGAIGHAIVRSLAGQGARVGVHYHKNRQGAALLVGALAESGVEAALFPADLSIPEEAARLAAQVESHFGQPVGILVNNAGRFDPDDALSTLTPALFHALMDTNFTGAVFVTQAVVPGMVRTGGGVIVNVASDAGLTGGARGVAIYSAAKAALLNFTKNLAREVAGSGIRVNAVAPGAISETPADAHRPDEVRRMLIARTPVGREGRPEDVADAVLFLASDLAGFVTGEALVVSGGLQMR